jgi:hypothetical protein
MERNLTKEDVERIAGEPLTLITAENKAQIMRQITNQAPYKRIDKYLIHYETGGDAFIKTGHWAGLIIDNIEKQVLFVDSYGYFPDDELNIIKPKYRKESGQTKRLIAETLYELSERGYDIYYNEIQFQKLKEGVNTCGRYVGLFCKFSKNKIMQPEDFRKLLSKIPGRSYDEKVVVMSQSRVSNRY